MKALPALILLAIALASLASLASGGHFLESVLPGGLPAGNAIAAVALISAAGVPLPLTGPGSALRVATLVTFGAAAAWLPVSIALAGNLALNFTGWRGSVWLAFTFAVQLAVLIAWFWALVGCLLSKRRRADVA